MSTQRYIDTSFWDDTWVQELDPSEKLLYIYLLTNPLTNIAGVMELTTKRICFDTGFNSDTVTHILRKFEQAKKVFKYKNYIIIRNFPKHQQLKSENVIKGIAAILSKLSVDVLAFLKEINYQFDIKGVFDTLGIPYTYPSNNLNLDLNLDLNSNLDLNLNSNSEKSETINNSVNGTVDNSVKENNTRVNNTSINNIYIPEEKPKKTKASETKRNSKAELFDRVDDYTDSNELRDILKQYLHFKLKNCKGFTLEQWNIQLDLLNQFSKGDINRAIEKVKFAFASNYQSLVYPNELNKNNQQQNIKNIKKDLNDPNGWL